MNNLKLLETVADISYIAGCKKYYSGNSRVDISEYIIWAKEFEKKSTNREGVAESKSLNTELLFIDLIKSEKDFSPSTLYQDYALSDTLFHWQSQNATRSDVGKGLSYIQHEDSGKKILLFVRERNENEYKNTMSYVFIGEGNYVEHYGSKPMSISWELNEPLPSYLWKESAKMAVG